MWEERRRRKVRNVWQEEWSERRESKQRKNVGVRKIKQCNCWGWGRGVGGGEEGRREKYRTNIRVREEKANRVETEKKGKRQSRQIIRKVKTQEGKKGHTDMRKQGRGTEGSRG